MKINGFTIVELLVVIVLIGILAAVTVASYTGISQKAVATSLQSDLVNASKVFKLYNIDNGQLPTSLDTSNCMISPADPRYCLRSSANNSYVNYQTNNIASPQIFYLEAQNGTTCYGISDNNAPTICAPPTITIGSQVWMRYNLNIGTMIPDSQLPVNDANDEKYCINNIESNCDIYGGLYTYMEGARYDYTELAQGMCPSNFHIPSDTDWYTLENYLDASINTPAALGWRGTNAGTVMLSGKYGTSGFNALAGGYINPGSNNMGVSGYYWNSTSKSVGRKYVRIFGVGNAQISRDGSAQTAGASALSNGLSIRCIKN